MAKLKFDEQDDDWWTCTSFRLHPESQPIRLTLTSQSEPDQPYIDGAMRVLASIDDLALKAAGHILDNYSYEYFKGLGIDDALLLKDETPEGMRGVAKLESVWFNGSECKDFELSFTVPWDEEHSFDVEFEDGEALHCAVNG